jgi:hypothetical protein
MTTGVASSLRQLLKSLAGCLFGATAAATLSVTPETAREQIFLVHRSHADQAVGEYNLDGTAVNELFVSGLKRPSFNTVSGDHLFVVFPLCWNDWRIQRYQGSSGEYLADLRADIRARDCNSLMHAESDSTKTNSCRTVYFSESYEKLRNDVTGNIGSLSS